MNVFSNGSFSFSLNFFQDLSFSSFFLPLFFLDLYCLGPCLSLCLSLSLPLFFIAFPFGDDDDD